MTRPQQPWQSTSITVQQGRTRPIRHQEFGPLHVTPKVIRITLWAVPSMY